MKFHFFKFLVITYAIIVVGCSPSSNIDTVNEVSAASKPLSLIKDSDVTRENCKAMLPNKDAFKACMKVYNKQLEQDIFTLDQQIEKKLNLMKISAMP